MHSQARPPALAAVSRQEACRESSGERCGQCMRRRRQCVASACMHACLWRCARTLRHAARQAPREAQAVLARQQREGLHHCREARGRAGGGWSLPAARAAVVASGGGGAAAPAAASRLSPPTCSDGVHEECDPRRGGKPGSTRHLRRCGRPPLSAQAPAAVRSLAASEAGVRVAGLGRPAVGQAMAGRGLWCLSKLCK